LLKLSRDKNFLLDRLLVYEKLSDSSDESDSSSAKPDEKPKPKRLVGGGGQGGIGMRDLSGNPGIR
jgi:hypothetical protein